MPNNINYQTPNSIVNMGFWKCWCFRVTATASQLTFVTSPILNYGDYYSSHAQTTTSNISAMVTNAVNQKTVSPGENENGIVSMHSMQRAEHSLHAEHVCDDEIFSENQNFCEQSGFFISEGIGTSGINDENSAFSTSTR